MTSTRASTRLPARAPVRSPTFSALFAIAACRVPAPIGDIVWQTTREKGVAAAIEQYRDLRQHFYGRSTYDFGEDTLIAVSSQMANVRPEDAIGADETEYRVLSAIHA